VAGESVLVHAAGSGVGVAAVQIAKAMGASFVAGTAGTDDKLSRAADIGLDLGINYRTADFAAEVARATGGRGVDVILDVIGAEYWDRNLQSLAPKGRMVLVGLMGGAATQANLGMLLMKRLQVRGTVLRARPLEEKAAATKAFEKSIVPHLASGRVRVIVDRVFPLSDVAEAHRYLESNANFGKVVLDVP
jgi:NADPH:quinone reductase-like Zn-dependent oxidoreductase